MILEDGFLLEDGEVLHNDFGDLLQDFHHLEGASDHLLQ